MLESLQKIIKALKNLSPNKLLNSAFEYNPRIIELDLKIGEKVGIYASSHGNIIALKAITEQIKSRGV